jgi:hypothetical protein
MPYFMPYFMRRWVALDEMHTEGFRTGRTILSVLTLPSGVTLLHISRMWRVVLGRTGFGGSLLQTEEEQCEAKGGVVLKNSKKAYPPSSPSLPRRCCPLMFTVRFRSLRAPDWAHLQLRADRIGYGSVLRRNYLGSKLYYTALPTPTRPISTGEHDRYRASTLGETRSRVQQLS